MNNMRKIEIMKTDFQAARAAKHFFAAVLDIEPSSVRVQPDEFHNNRYQSTQCVCGETRMTHFAMSNAGAKQQTILDAKIDRTGAVVAYGICESCGENF